MKTAMKFVAILMILGLALVAMPIAKVQAQTPTNYTLITRESGTASISTEQFHSANSSLKFTTGDALNNGDVGMARFNFAPGDFQLDELTNLSYWEYVDSRENNLDIFLDIWLDFDHNGIADANDYPGYMQAEPYYVSGAAPLDTWTFIDGMSLKWSTYVGPDDPYNAPTIAQLQANTAPAAWTNSVDFGALDILRIDIRVGYGYPTWNNFIGYADDITINSYVETFPPSEVWVCPTGDCGHPGAQFSTIQAGIDAVSVGGTVNVFPGDYSETASGREIVTMPGVTYQFGLFFDDSKPGITVQGVKSDGSVITSYGDVGAKVTTNSTANFGPDGVFVEADNITISGLEFLNNAGGDNKTIEVIGNNVTIKNNIFSIEEQGGSVYLNDWRYDKLTPKSYLEKYTIDGNFFRYDTSVDISSGVGVTGLVADRKIINNVFDAQYSTGETGEYATISFNGYCPSVAWFTDPVGGATISGNTFSHGKQYIRTRCIADTAAAGFDWASYWSGNTFDAKVISGSNPPTNVTHYNYGSFTDVQRISGLSIQDAIDIAKPGDTILVGPGTYDAFKVDGKSNLTIVGAGSGSTIIAPSALISTGVGHKYTPNMLASVFVSNSTGIKIEGMTIKSTAASPGAGGADAIVFWNASSGEIKNSILQGIYPITGAQTGQGLAVDAGTGHPSALTLTSVNISGFQKNAIDAVDGNAGTSGAGNITLNINGGTITGAGPTSAIAQNGIMFWNRAGGVLNGSVTGVTISGFNYIPDTNDATGVLAYGLGGGTLNITNSTFGANEIHIDNEESPAVNASPNWWGSQAGPACGSIVGPVTYIPWCTDASCGTTMSLGSSIDIPAGTPGPVVQTYMCNAPDNATLNFLGSMGPQSGGFIINKPLTILLKNGTVVQNNSPCFTVNADYVTIKAESLAGAKCVPTGDADGILVTGARKNLVLEKFEIDGSAIGTSGNNGVHFDNVMTDLVIADLFVHNLKANGFLFDAQPAGILDIHGNMFRDNAGNGIEAGDFTIPAEFNSWGSYDGPAAPAGDGISANVDADPWTHVDLTLASSASPWPNTVVNGSTITYTVTGNLQNVTGADFVLKYPANLTYSTSTLGANFDIETLDTATAGQLHFVAYKYGAGITGHKALFTVTFTGATLGKNLDMNLDETTDGFAMATAGSSTNIYAYELYDGKANVVALPTMDIVPLPQPTPAPCIVGLPCPFQLHINNPTTGLSPVEEWYVNFTIPAGAILEVNDGGWIPVTNPFVIGAVAPDGVTITPSFRVTFITPGNNTISANLMDPNPPTPIADYLLVSASETFNALGDFTIKGTFSMQGRTFRGGVPVTLTKSLTPIFGPYSGSTTNILFQNLTLTGVQGGTYLITTLQPRYLNVIAANNKTVLVNGNRTFSALELKGGNCVWTDNEIGVGDASCVGGMYGVGTIADNADVNFDNKVNIQDLALVGGNFYLTSENAYGIGSTVTWIP